MIHDEICTYEVCKLAKEKGFPVKEIECWYCEYDGRPTKEIIDEQQHPIINQSLLQRWLREEKGVVVIPYFQSVLKRWSATYELLPPRHSKYAFIDLRKDFRTYELALEDALKFALENLA